MSVDFICSGLVFNKERVPVNIRDLAVKPMARGLSTPIVFVAATSSEAGKTVLAGKLIRHLSAARIRVGALKVTGTGGVLDSLHHLRSGATATLDNVDAGLITTHCDSLEFRNRIPSIFRQIGSMNVDLIVAELGGDILSANNPVIFTIQELMKNSLLLLIISNDALSAAGVNAFNDTQLRFATRKIRHFTSPFRNHAGMARRMALVGIHDCYDPDSSADLSQIVTQIIHGLGPKIQRGRDCSA
jgi:hypothetical protein